MIDQLIAAILGALAAITAAVPNFATAWQEFLAAIFAAFGG